MTISKSVCDQCTRKHIQFATHCTTTRILLTKTHTWFCCSHATVDVWELIRLLFTCWLGPSISGSAVLPHWSHMFAPSSINHSEALFLRRCLGIQTTFPLPLSSSKIELPFVCFDLFSNRRPLKWPSGFTFASVYSLHVHCDFLAPWTAPACFILIQDLWDSFSLSSGICQGRNGQIPSLCVVYNHEFPICDSELRL